MVNIPLRPSREIMTKNRFWNACCRIVFNYTLLFILLITHFWTSFEIDLHSVLTFKQFFFSYWWVMKLPNETFWGKFCSSMELCIDLHMLKSIRRSNLYFPLFFLTIVVGKQLFEVEWISVLSVRRPHVVLQSLRYLVLYVYAFYAFIIK